MKMPQPSCPLTSKQVVDIYFMEHRAKLLDIAAFLDRLERAADQEGLQDVRVRALKKQFLFYLIQGVRIMQTVFDRCLNFQRPYNGANSCCTHTVSTGADPNTEY